jgi:hypothetical protein
LAFYLLYHVDVRQTKEMDTPMKNLQAALKESTVYTSLEVNTEAIEIMTSLLFGGIRKGTKKMPARITWMCHIYISGRQRL